MELIDLKGVGPKRAALFADLGIHSPEDLLQYYPHEYLDYSQYMPLSQAEDGKRMSFLVTAQADPTVFYHKGKYIVSLRVADASCKATIRWINQPYRLNQFHTGDVLFVNGVVSKKRGLALYNPQVNRDNGGIIPIYATVKGLTQSVIRDAVAAVIDKCELIDSLPVEWISRYKLVSYAEALKGIHFPSSTAELEKAKRRISFEETFLYFAAIRAAKSDRERKNGFAFRTDNLKELFLQSLTFDPTKAQLRAMCEIEEDMRSARPMNRLIQGDVGSGKTLVAEYALKIASKNGKQGILLAPTELLAEQHYHTLKKRFPSACLLVGSMSEKEKKIALADISSGKADVVVGTHALLSDTVKFFDLGLVVTDEQHRFGVMQRAKIEAKGIRPDVLVMSATPIPRTLALLIYADLDLSVIDMMPPGRKPVKTYYVPQSKRCDLYRHIASCTQNNERAYIVCPLIEPTEGFEGLSLEELYAEIGALLPNNSIGVLHGQMHENEKRAAMEAFRTGSISILISTTVVEVGVDVPEATTMIIEGADHFGLATLHQLRGRVGRGNKQSYCYLLSSKRTGQAKERIEAMLNNSDGFAIAQRDFEMRGSGDLFGVRQSGDGEMNAVLSGSTVEIIEMASQAANDIFALPSVQYNTLLEQAQSRYGRFRQIAHN